MKKMTLLLVILILAVSAVGCSTAAVDSTTSVQIESVDPESAASASAASSEAVATVSADAGAESVAAAQEDNSETHADADDFTWESAEVMEITLDGSAISAHSKSVSVDGTTATITAPGTYQLAGSLTDGQIVVDTDQEGIVRLILNGVDIANSDSAALYIANADEAMVVLAEGTQNTLSDSANYVFEKADEDEPNATLFSTADLTIYGDGALTVHANYNDGITSKDGLIIASGTLDVTAVDDGIRGKDYLVVENGSITVNAGGDGLKADNEEDTTKGYVTIENGVLNITAGGDGIDAATDVLVVAGEVNIVTAGGSNAQIDETTSAKGIKAGVNLNIDGGTFNIDAADDAFNSNGSLVINAGTFTLKSGDDGMHADSTLEINAGQIDIQQSYEGIESALITINNGEIRIVASDDGINVAGGNDASGAMQGFGPGAGGGGPRGGGGGPTQDNFASTSSSYSLTINGGTLYINAQGDGLDSNGSITMTGGTVIVDGPTQSMNGALDYNNGFSMNGGFLITAGSAGMAMGPSQNSTQNSILVNFTSTLAAGSLIHIQASDGSDILTFAPAKDIQSITFSSAELLSGETYTVYLGGSVSGASVDGLTTDGTYSGGSEYTSLTISGSVTSVGGGGMRP